MTTPTCPITGEPLLNPGQVASRGACNRLKTATSNLVDIMSVIDDMIRGAGRGETVGRTAYGSRAPLNLSILSATSDWRDTIDIWASNLIEEANPSFRYQSGNWRMAQAIFQRYADYCSHWIYENSRPGVLCIERVVEAVGKLEHIANPPEVPQFTGVERLRAQTQLENSLLAAGPACQAITLITGKPLSQQTIYSWERRGKVVSIGAPKRYPIGDLLRLHNEALVR